MKRRIPISAGILFLISLSVVNNVLAKSSGRRVFLLEDSEHHRWCAYGNESEWAKEVKSLTATVVGTVEYTGDQVSKINITEEDEAGDWVAYDHYVIDDKAEIRELKRTINILPGDRSEEEMFLVRDGKAKKQSSSSRSLSTKEVLPAQQKEDWLPNVPITTNLQDFPFAALVLEKHSKRSDTGKVCVPVKQPVGHAILTPRVTFLLRAGLTEAWANSRASGRASAPSALPA